MVEDDEYSALVPELPPWPPVLRTPDGWWTRHWEVVLSNLPQTKPISELEERLCSDGKRVKIEIHDRSVLVDVITRDWGWDDPLYFYNHAVLEFLERALGRIETINGQPKSTWIAWWPRPGRNPFFS